MQSALCQKPFVAKAAPCKASIRGRRQMVCMAQRQEQSLASKAAAVRWDNGSPPPHTFGKKLSPGI